MEGFAVDKTWQKNLLAFLGLLAALFTVYAFIAERPSSVVDSRVDSLEKRIVEEKNNILTYVDTRDQAKTTEIQAVNTNINQKFDLLMKAVDKLDDRLYDMSRKQEQASRHFMQDDDGT